MATSYSDRDLDLIPNFTFSFVENYIKQNKSSTGQKSINKGFKYFSEGYIKDLKGNRYLLYNYMIYNILLHAFSFPNTITHTSKAKQNFVNFLQHFEVELYTV